MSRGDFGTGTSYGSTSVSYHRIPSARQKDQFNSICDNISGKIFIINKNVSRLESLSRNTDDEKETEKKVHSLSQDTNNAANEIKHLFMKVSDFMKSSNYNQYDINKQRQYTILQNKLRREFENSLSRYQAIQNSSSEPNYAEVLVAVILFYETISLRMKAVIAKEKEESSFHEYSNTGTLSFDDKDDDEEILIQDDTRQQQEQKALEDDLEEAKEREARLVQIEKDILDVNKIFRDLAVIVHEQGDVIDSIESHIEHTAIHVEQGHKELVRASKYQKSARKKMCILALVTLVAATIIAIIIYYSVK